MQFVIPLPPQPSGRPIVEQHAIEVTSARIYHNGPHRELVGLLRIWPVNGLTYSGFVVLERAFVKMQCARQPFGLRLRWVNICHIVLKLLCDLRQPEKLTVGS